MLGLCILVLKDGYNKNVPPIKSSEPVDVSSSMNVLKLKLDIADDDYSIEIQFQITFMQKENRVTYHNLKNRDTLNALMQSDFEKLWLPKIIYENTDQKQTTRLGEFRNGECETRAIVNFALGGRQLGPGQLSTLLFYISLSSGL